MSGAGNIEPRRTFPVAVVAGIAAVSLALIVAWPAVLDLADKWINNEAYSHGFVVLAVALFLGIQQLSRLEVAPRPSLWFLPALLFSLVIVLTARLSELHVVAQYGLFGVIGSLVLGTFGWVGLRRLTIPLVLLFLSIPIPGYFEVNLTAELKLISSQMGAALLSRFGVPVFLEGNIIDLGVYRLQVADACSGLNYLIPLLAIGVMIAGFLNTTAWRRVAIVLLTIPLTVAMNVLRIAIAGMLVRYVGPGTAEGFVHDFEGWMVFVSSLLLLLPLIAVLLRIGPQRTTLKQALVVDFELKDGLQVPVASSGRRNLLLGLGLVALTLLASLFLQDREKVIPQRSEFSVFPRLLNDWVGTTGTVDQRSLLMLRLTDYLYSSYQSPRHRQSVELFTSYYAAQSDGATPHSPNICLPGAGWEIVKLERTGINLSNGPVVPVNRALMERRGEKMLVYYWFQQRGRLFANEFVMKWYIIQDSITMNRTDGSLVRLTTRLDGTEKRGEERLNAFLEEIWPVLPRFLPN